MVTEKTKKMTIGQLAKKAGINLQTVRYYESLGILPEPERTESGYRQYTENYIEHILFIKNAQELGFSLEEIQKLVNLKNSKEAMGEDVKAIVKVKIKEINEKIQSMEELKGYLSSLNKSCSGNMSTDKCPILQSLRSGIK